MTTTARRRTPPSQCNGCGRFVGPASSAWATGYHTECEPPRPTPPQRAAVDRLDAARRTLEARRANEGLS